MALRFPGPARAEPTVRVRPRENGVVLAVFDMEGTIVSSNVVEAYLWLRLAELPRERWAGQVASVARAMPSYLSAERRDRGEFLRSFYRRYEGASVEGVDELVREHVAELLLQRVAPGAVRRIRQHHAAELFAREYMRASDHTNFQMAAKSLTGCVKQMEEIFAALKAARAAGKPGNEEPRTENEK